MSSIVYNGIYLPYPQTTSFIQDVVADQSDTDWMCTKFDIQAQFLINYQYLNIIAPDLFNANVFNSPADIMAAIRTKLMERRKELSYKVNGIEMIPLKAGVPGSVDAQNGPKPVRCQILQLTAETFIVIYHIIAHYWENNNPTSGRSPLVTENLPGSPILSNRWTEESFIDDCMYTTRKRSGKYVIRSDNSQGLPANEYRGLAVLGIPTGFQRMSTKYTLDPSGLGMSYEFVDKEVYKYPPFPAYRAEGHYTESTNLGGVFRMGECKVKLWGGPTLQAGNQATQFNLVAAAIGIVSSKLAIVGAPLVTGVEDNKKNRAFPLGAYLTIDMYKNIVEAGIKVRFGQPKRKIDGLAAFYRDRGIFTPGSDPVDARPIYQLYGSAIGGTALMQAAAYYDPNIPTLAVNAATGQLTNGVQPGQAGLRG